MATNKHRVLISKSLAPAGLNILQARDDVEAILYAPTTAAPELQARLFDIDGIVLSLNRFGTAELAAAPRMKVVARIGVGFDTVDVPALTARKIPLMTVGLANAPSVAEQAFSLLFALAKRNAQHDAAVRAGTWRDSLTAYPVDFLNKVLLIVGFGRIGTRVAKRALAFEMRVLVYDPYVPAHVLKAAGCEPVTDLDAAVTAADFITVHCPKNAETAGMFGAARLARMKPSAYLVNTARGGIIDEAALCAALAENRIAGAGIDVFEREPAAVDHPLLKLPNAIVSPHIAGVTVESLERMSVAAAENVLSVLDGRPIRENAVNPEVFG
jgi:D-3-phosphoglycerate dehydrogenase